jgi:hypothetical protein
MSLFQGQDVSEAVALLEKAQQELGVAAAISIDIIVSGAEVARFARVSGREDLADILAELFGVIAAKVSALGDADPELLAERVPQYARQVQAALRAERGGQGAVDLAAIAVPTDAKDIN